MTIRPDRLLAHAFPETRQRYAKRDTILYALGVGLGCDPIAAEDLPFLLEDRLIALPTFASTLGFLGMWIRAPEFGVNFANLVHYEQATRFHAPLPPEADIISSARVASVTDRGEGKGAVVVIEREIRDSTLEARYCTLRQTLLLRADGGFRGAPTPHVPSIIPDREPDARASFPTDSRAALIYRLSGDWNPLHADPEAAKRGGFERPILHGLASYAIAAIAVALADSRRRTSRGLTADSPGSSFPATSSNSASGGRRRARSFRVSLANARRSTRASSPLVRQRERRS
jgi:acyl dehydratase